MVFFVLKGINIKDKKKEIEMKRAKILMVDLMIKFAIYFQLRTTLRSPLLKSRDNEIQILPIKKKQENCDNIEMMKLRK